MIPIDDVVDISKAYTMKIFPNAIKIISHNHQVNSLILTEHAN